MNNKTTFATLLKRYRSAAKLTQAELAERASLSTKAISALERGVNRFPRKDTLSLLIQALRLSPEESAQLESARAPSASAYHTTLNWATRAETALQNMPPEPDLLGREREIELIERHVLGQGPPVLAVAGEPGIGKSRLLLEVARRASMSGLVVLEGGCRGRGGQEPFVAILDALGDSIQKQHASGARHHLTGCNWLVRLLPELLEDGLVDAPKGTLRPEQERRLIFRAVSRYFANLATTTSAILLLDDMQWVDADSVDLLLHLAGVAKEIGLRIVLAYRNTELVPQSPLAEGFNLLVHAHAITHLQIGPLSEDVALQLVQATMGNSLHEADAHFIVKRAGGVPFYLLSWSFEQSAGQRVHEGSLKPSWDVTQSIRQRVMTLPSVAQRVVEITAVFGRSVTLDVLLSACKCLGIQNDELFEALDDLCHAHLLLTQQLGIYTFAHDLIREVIENGLGPTRRVALFREAANALERISGPRVSELIGYLYTASDEREKAATYLETSGDRAMMMHAHMRAAQAYRDLARQNDVLGRVKDGAKAREKLGDALIVAARHDEALDALNGAMAVHRAEGDHESIVRVAARMGEAHALRGSPEQGLAAIQPIIDEMTNWDVSPHSLAALLVSASWLINCTGDYVGASVMAQRSAKVAAAAHDALLSVQANLRYGHLLLMLERLDEGARVLEAVIPLAEGIDDLRSIRFALNTLGWSHELRGNFDLDRKYTERAVEVALLLGDPSVIAFMKSNEGGPYFNIGDWKRARVHFEEGLAVAKQTGSTWASAWSPLLLGQLELVEGNFDKGEALLLEAIELAESTTDLQAQRWANGTLAEWDLLRARPQEALDRLIPLIEHSHLQVVDVCLLLPLYAWALFDLGQLAEAAHVASEGVARATTAKMLPTLANALRVRAMSESREGNWKSAKEDLARALELCRALHSPYGEAKCLFTYAVCSFQQGQPKHATHLLRQAQTILAGLGEELYAEHVKEALHQPALASARLIVSGSN